MRDDGVSGAPSIEVNEDNDLNVRNLPTLRSVDVELSTLGTYYTFQLFVSNREGTASSSLITFLFAIEPSAPSVAPSLLDYTSTYAYVSYLFVDDIQGSDIISHNL